ILYSVILTGQVDPAFTTSEGAWVWVFVTLVLGFMRELFTSNIHQAFLDFNPAQLFVGSFLLLILLGALALMLPEATYEPISLIDALFMSTSAVCVTGMLVLDTALDFTPFGQGILLLLFQLGGLGIMTFTSFFSFFFRGENQLQKSIAHPGNHVFRPVDSGLFHAQNHIAIYAWIRAFGRYSHIWFTG